MAIPYKKVQRSNPFDLKAAPKFYVQLVTLGQTATLESIAYEMKETSSLSLGDIKSVLTNFVTAMRRALYNGHSVNIPGFGVFSLSARCDGAETIELCSVKKIRKVKINFRASSDVKPSLASKNAGDVMEFVDVEKALDRGEEELPQE
ncbi:HU family DNA-binding protein [Phocaeicola sp.]